MDRRLLPFMLALAFGGCGKGEPVKEAAPRDPAVARALNDPLMIDPDLSQRNEAGAAITVETDLGLPVVPTTPEAIVAARADAARLVGGIDNLLPPPAASAEVAELPNEWSPGHHLTAIGANGACLKGLRDGTIYAARLPATLPVYPRGATLGAAGSDAAGCRARAVRFATPVAPDDVLAFYWARAKSGRLDRQHLSSGQTAVVRGSGPGLAFDVRVRSAGDQTLVELATFNR